MAESWTDHCLDYWYIQPGSFEARDRVLQFIQKIHVFNNNKAHPVFATDSDNLQARLNANPYTDLKAHLWEWNCPRIHSLINADVAKDFDVVLDADKIEFLRDIRSTFILYLRSVTTQAFLTKRVALEMFELAHVYLQLFKSPQYGMSGTWNSLLRKLLDFIHLNHFVFLPYLMEWCEHMVTPEHYPICSIKTEDFERDIKWACDKHPTLGALFQKHQSKFQLYLPLH